MADSTTKTSPNALNAATLRNQYPRIPWIQEVWQHSHNRYERIATASPRMGIAVLGHSLLEQHLALAPTIWTAADFSPVLDDHGERVGVRLKLATWPLTKKEVIRSKDW